MPEIIKLDQINKTYKNGPITVTALRDANIAIHEGEMVAITGPSGSGKSTLMHILGLLDRPTSGTLQIHDTPVDFTMSDAKLARLRSEKIGFVFQAFNLLPRLSALENVMLPAMYFRGDQKPNRERGLKLLDDLGMAHRSQHKPNELSGGEKQRVAIARSLLNNPDIILADEPTGNLDSKSGLEVLEILTSLHSQGKTVVIITHDPNIAEMCQRNIKLLDGAIVAGDKRARRKQ